MRIVALNIGTAPAEEACAQTGVTEEWIALQKLEATTYRAALIAVHGPLQAGVAMPVMTYGHDFAPAAALRALAMRLSAAVLSCSALAINATAGVGPSAISVLL